jgi:hypothetical protein
MERRHPINLAKIKNVTMRSKESVVLSPEQFRDVVKRLPENVNMIAVTMGCLCLRVSEALGLKWEDIDWERQTVTIRRSAYRGSIDETKTASSKAKLPLHPALPCSRSPIGLLSCTLAAVASAEWISLIPASTPTWAFMPKCHCPFLLVERISGSRSPLLFLVEEGAPRIVASQLQSTIVPVPILRPCCSR